MVASFGVFGPMPGSKTHTEEATNRNSSRNSNSRNISSLSNDDGDEETSVRVPKVSECFLFSIACRVP